MSWSVLLSAARALDSFPLAPSRLAQELMDRADLDQTTAAAARFVSGATLYSLLSRARFAYQRVSRGWADSDVWNLDVFLCTRLADQLDHLADTTHGWPATDEFPEFANWQEALHSTARDLRRVSESAQAQQALDAWYEAAYGDGDREQAALLWERLNQVEADDALAVESALRWVVDHHRHLWD